MNIHRIATRLAMEWCQTHPNHPICHHNMGIPRRQMPQIKRPHQDDFAEFLISRGYRIRDTAKRVGDLKATQKNLIPRYVEGIASEGVHSIIQGKPMWASSDGYILDGHHRWAALLMLDPNQKIRIREVNVPIRKLLQLVSQFPHTQYSDAA